MFSSLRARAGAIRQICGSDVSSRQITSVIAAQRHVRSWVQTRTDRLPA